MSLDGLRALKQKNGCGKAFPRPTEAEGSAFMPPATEALPLPESKRRRH